MRFLDRYVGDRVFVIRVLQMFFGVGFRRALIICKRFGLSKTLRMFEIPKSKLIIVEKYLRGLELGSKRSVFKVRRAVLFQKRCGSFRGIRLGFGLPVRGQRSHTNASTVLKMTREGYFWGRKKYEKKRKY